MDPQATWNMLCENWKEGNWLEVIQLAESLLDWLAKDGFAPEANPGVRMGDDWNRVVVSAACEFAVRRATAVVESPHGIPSDVPFTLSCDSCGNEGPDTLDEALAEGWLQLRYTPVGLSENFLGSCPDCQREDDSG